MASKKVKTFEEKQETTPLQKQLIHNVKMKNAGVKRTEVPVDFEQLKKKAKSHEPQVAKKIITQDDILAEQKNQLEEDKRFTEEFKRQLSTWAEEDHHSEYEWCEFDHEDYLVRLFSMDVSSFEKFIDLRYEYSKIMNEWTLKTVSALDSIFPIVKILKVGDAVKEARYNVGDIAFVPSNDIIGKDWNPKFLQTIQFQSSKGMKPVLPDGMEQEILNVEKNWDRYMFVRPWVAKPEPQDKLTYLIPSPKIRGTFNYKKYGV